MPVTV